MLTYDNTTREARVYKDGVFVKSFSGCTGLLCDYFGPGALDLTNGEVDGSTLFKIRPSEDDEYAFQGDISRYRLYDRALADDEIRANFEFGNTQGMAGVVLGDINNDASVNNLDITPFIAALAAEDEAAFLEAFPDGNYAAADIDMSGGPDNLDITPFIGLLTATGATAVPEPSSLVCVVLALMMGRRRAVRR